MSWTLSFANSPKGSNSLGNVDDEIRQLKKEIADFMGRDHYFTVPATGTSPEDITALSLQGRMKPGSAKVQSGVGSTMGFPTTRPDGSSFTEADDGRVIWAYDSVRGLQQYVGYWKSSTAGLKWWPISNDPVGTIKAYRGAWQQLIGDPTNLIYNTMPGWVACTGVQYGNAIYDFGLGRSITVSWNTVDLRDRHLKGSVASGADYSSTFVTGGVTTPKIDAFSKSFTIGETNLPSHKHALNDANGKPTVANHDPVNLKGIYGAGSGGPYGIFWSAGLAATPNEWISTPTFTHTVTWAANQFTDVIGGGQAIQLDFSEITVPQKSFDEVVWIVKVI